MNMANHSQARNPAARIGRRKKIMFISTYKIPCGIGAFTETLETHLEGEYEIEIGVLDQYILKSIEPPLDAAGDRLIDDICLRARECDVVNLQWEPGLLGHTPKQILRRFKKILQSNPHMIVTVHTVVPIEKKASILQALRETRHQGIFGGARYISNTMLRRYGDRTHQLLREAAKSETFQLVVYTQREVRHFRELIGIKNVHDHPLSYIRRGWEERLATTAGQMRDKWKKQFGADKKFIGFFGFLTEYKGISTAIEAMRLLPDDYMLMLFGGVHPALLHDGQNVSPYVHQLMTSVHPSLAGSKGVEAKRSLVDRVRFIGAPDDYEFAAAILASDINVFPYVEIGQSASGPVSQSVELGKRTIVSNNKMFSQFELYFLKRTYKTDIGNHIQLAQMVQTAMDEPEPGVAGLGYNNKTLTDFYRIIIERASGAHEPALASSANAAPIGQIQKSA